MNNLDKKYTDLLGDAYKRCLEYTIMGVNNGFDRIEGHLDNCLVEHDGDYEHFTNPSFQYGYRPHTKEEFINEIKTDDEFAKKWGVMVEIRELSLDERFELFKNQNNGSHPEDIEMMDDYNIPTKLITITYNNEKIEIYE